jgi:RNA polymerase sigma-70 factor (ECF subfamily)
LRARFDFFRVTVARRGAKKFRIDPNLDRVPHSYIQLDAPESARRAVRMMLFPLFLAIHVAEDDSGLVARMQRRDPQALAELYDRYGRITYSLILRVVRDGAIAEDLVQETFLRVWNRVHGFDAQKGSIGPWLLAVARNRAIDYLRSAGGRERNAVEFEETDHPALYCDMEKDLLSADNARKVKSAVEKLAPNQRQVIELAYFEGLSQTEMAARLGQPLGTVKTWVRSALKNLREDLGAAVSA